ncbi:MAG: divergent polysaccharide deacetylase family protein [Pseudomonadota bacterium]
MARTRRPVQSSAKARASRRRAIKRAGRGAAAATALAGVALGAFGVYMAGQGAEVHAARLAAAASGSAERTVLNGADAAFAARAAYVDDLVTQTEPEAAHLGATPTPTPRSDPLDPGAGRRVFQEIAPRRPKIIVIFDDMGLDAASFDRLMAMPGPLTFSFLPYADGVQAMADRAAARGDAVMLHLPMQPIGGEDPGPGGLRPDMTASELLSTLRDHLDAFDGYGGVKNHMGSAFTADLAGMKTVLSVLDAEGVFFLDSLTTAKSKAAAAARAVGAQIFRRDVFLDPDLDRATVFKQLQTVEKIARETGYAVAIAHPRVATIDVIGPWLTTAPARGFDLATVDYLRQVDLTLAERDRARPRSDS